MLETKLSETVAVPLPNPSFLADPFDFDRDLYDLWLFECDDAFLLVWVIGSFSS